jgi:hypothetical protein
MHTKDGFPLRGAIIGAAFVTVFWLLCFFEVLSISPDEQSALFTGLGFVGVVAAFLHERQQAAEGDVAHDELLSAMKAQAMAVIEAARINAAAEKLKRFDELAEWSNRTGHVPFDWEGDRNTYMNYLAEERGKLHALFDDMISGKTKAP